MKFWHSSPSAVLLVEKKVFTLVSIGKLNCINAALSVILQVILLMYKILEREDLLVKHSLK